MVSVFVFSTQRFLSSSSSLDKNGDHNRGWTIIGAGPGGIATSACLNHLSIPNIVLEQEDCSAPIWRNKTYDCLSLHIAKQFCHFPHMPFPKDFPKFIPRELFIQYLDDYMSQFNVTPLYNRCVESVTFDQLTQKWCVKVKNKTLNEFEEYSDKFLVLASGGFGAPFIPHITGLDTFPGNTVHSADYKSGEAYSNKNVLVVGAGNSAMEVAFDLSNYGAKTSIVIRSPITVVHKEMLHIGLCLMRLKFPLAFVDWFVVTASRLVFGDLTKYGIAMAKEGPFYRKQQYGIIPVVDAGAASKIKTGKIQILPSITRINGDVVEFKDGSSHPFDAIVFGRGFEKPMKKWFKEQEYLKEDGFPKEKPPNHWKGKNGFYYVGAGRRGLPGIATESQQIANDMTQVHRCNVGILCSWIVYSGFLAIVYYGFLLILCSMSIHCYI